MSIARLAVGRLNLCLEQWPNHRIANHLWSLSVRLHRSTGMGRRDGYSPSSYHQAKKHSRCRVVLGIYRRRDVGRGLLPADLVPSH